MYNELCNIKVKTNVVKCLGIFMGHNKIEYYRKSWINKSEELEKNCLKHGRRGSSRCLESVKLLIHWLYLNFCIVHLFYLCLMNNL